MINPNFVFLGALISLCGSTSYFVSTLRGRARPNRVTFFLWAFAPMVAFVAELDQGVEHQAVMTFMVGFGPAMILLASFISKSASWKITRFDIVCGVLSLCAVVLWLITSNPNVAIAFAVLADGLAALPTVIKAYEHPRTENPWVYWGGSLNATLTLLTIDDWTFATWAFPVYILAVCVLLGSLVTFRIGERSRPTSIMAAG